MQEPDAPRGPAPGVGSPYLTGTSWLPTGWNQPWTHPRTDAGCFNSAAVSYADRPRVPRPHALHFMGLTPAARYRAMAEVGTQVPAPRVAVGS